MKRSTTHLLLLAIAVLALALAGCAGSTDGDGSNDLSTDGVETGDLPTAEDLGVEGEPTTSGMCVEDEPDCEDMIVSDDGGDAAGASCLAGDEDCTDESYGGQDVTRPVRLVEDFDEAIAPAERGATSGASGRALQHATPVDDDTLRLVFIGNSCVLVEDVLVTESPAEVRVLLLAGQDATVDACDDEGLWWSVDVDLDAPLGDRALLDLAG